MIKNDYLKYNRLYIYIYIIKKLKRILPCILVAGILLSGAAYASDSIVLNHQDTDYSDMGMAPSETRIIPAQPIEQVKMKRETPAKEIEREDSGKTFQYSYAESNPAFSGFKSTPNDLCLKFADEILEGTLFVSELMDGYSYGDISTIDWNVSYTTSPNTFQLYMQGLTPLEVLSRAYQMTSDVRYLEYGVELIESWIAYSLNSERNQGNTLLWHDHGTAIRAESLLYFMLVSEGTSVDTPALRECIYSQLVLHAQFLADDVHYTKNHNHGIIQDVALLHVAYFVDHTDSQAWIEKAVERLKGQLEFAFNVEMVHVENSPGYNAAVIDSFYEIGCFLENRQNPEGQALMEHVYDAAEFLAWVTMPNGITAQLGDTASSKNLEEYTVSKYEKYRNERLNFTTSLGALDEMTEEQKNQRTKYYSDAGYFFYRENWASEQIKDTTWKLFKAGYSSRTHKHADDTSFMLYSKGYEIFSDMGWYNYMSGTPYRTYFISSSAHNVVTVDEKSYSPTAENAGKTGILFYNEQENLDEVAAFNNMYSGVEMDRHFYSSGDLTVLYDNILSEENHTYSQLFHLAENIHILSQSDDETVLSIADTGYTVRMRQMLPAQLEVISGKTDGQPMYGHMSRGLNHIQNVETLRYVQNASNTDYITVITIEDQNGQIMLKDGTRIHYSEINFIPESQSLTFGNQSITFSERIRPSIKAEIEIGTDANLNVTILPEEGFQHALYVIDAGSAKVLHKTGFSAALKFEYDLSGLTSDLFIKGYATSTQYGQRTNEMIGALIYDPVSGQYHVDQREKYPYLNLDYQGHHVEQVDTNTYRFCIDYNYSWTTTQRWYIYRNGAYYSVLQTKNQPVLEYQFAEPGEYTISYYFRTANGDYEFWDFDIISIL